MDENPERSRVGRTPSVIGRRDERTGSEVLTRGFSHGAYADGASLARRKTNIVCQITVEDFDRLRQRVVVARFDHQVIE